MLKYLGWRLAVMVPLLFALAVISFGLVVLIEARAGSAADVILEDGAGDREAAARLEEALGLDEPIPERFGSWLWGAARGDFGSSLVQRDVSVMTLINARIWPTLSIVGLSVVIASIVGILFGVLSGLRPGGKADRSLSITSAVMMSAPAFAIALALIVIAAVRLGWFDPTGYRKPSEAGWWLWLKSITLPALSLALPMVAVIQRQLRSSMTRALQSTYVLAARARGVPRPSIVRRHAMRNAMVPTVTVIGFYAGSAIGLSTAVERVFNIPGAGTLLVDSIVRRDVPVVQGLLMIMGLTVVIVNIIVDLSYAWLNPKVRLS